MNKSKLNLIAVVAIVAAFAGSIVVTGTVYAQGNSGGASSSSGGQSTGASTNNSTSAGNSSAGSAGAGSGSK